MAKQKLTKRQTQANKTRNKLYKASMELMEKKGFNNTTIEEISKKAGVSIGTFYLYYKSKDDIFFEIYKKADEYFKNDVAEQFTNEKLNSVDQIVLFFKFYAGYNKTRGLDNVRQLYNTKNKLFISKGRYMQILLEEIISKGQEKDEIIIEMTPESLTEYLFIAARGVVYDWCLHDAEYDLEERMVQFFERFIISIKKSN